LEIGCGAWRASFTVNADAPRVTITGLGPGYPLWQLQREGAADAVADREAQKAFLERWPESELPLKSAYRGARES
jgi:hypothetical protein